MEIMTFIEQLFELFIFPAIIILGKFVIQFLQIKTKEIAGNASSLQEKKYIEMISQTIQMCVVATNQTYVDTLKAQGRFDATAQQIAFEKTYQAVVSVLNTELKDYIKEVYGDLEVYLTQQIESYVNQSK